MDENKAAINSIFPLIGSIHTHLMDIKPKTPKQKRRWDQAVDTLVKYENEQLFRLQKAFEK